MSFEDTRDQLACGEDMSPCGGDGGSCEVDPYAAYRQGGGAVYRVVQQPSDCSGTCPTDQRQRPQVSAYDHAQAWVDNVRQQVSAAESKGERIRWNREEYDQHTNAAFDFQVKDSRSYRDALFTAAAEHKPVVMMFFHGETDPASQAAVQLRMEEARKQYGDKAVFVGVDMDRVNKNSEIGKYAYQYMERAPWGNPSTMVFSMRQGEGNYPVVPERPVFFQRGLADMNRLGQAVNQSAFRMQQITQQRDFAPVVRQIADMSPFAATGRTETFNNLLDYSRSIPGNTGDEKRQIEATLARAEEKAANDKAKLSLIAVERALHYKQWGFDKQAKGWLQKAAQLNPELLNNQYRREFLSANFGIDPDSEAGKPYDAYIQEGLSAGQPVQTQDTAPTQQQTQPQESAEEEEQTEEPQAEAQPTQTQPQTDTQAQPAATTTNPAEIYDPEKDESAPTEQPAQQPTQTQPRRRSAAPRTKTAIVSDSNTPKRNLA